MITVSFVLFSAVKNTPKTATVIVTAISRRIYWYGLMSRYTGPRAKGTTGNDVSSNHYVLHWIA